MQIVQDIKPDVNFIYIFAPSPLNFAWLPQTVQVRLLGMGLKAGNGSGNLALPQDASGAIRYKNMLNRDRHLQPNIQPKISKEISGAAVKRVRAFLFGWMMFSGLVGAFAQAQIDPSSALLLNGSARSNSRDNGLDSGRYTVRPRSDMPRSRNTGEDSAPRSRLRTVETSSPASNAMTSSQSNSNGNSSGNSTAVSNTNATTNLTNVTAPSNTQSNTVVNSETAARAEVSATVTTTPVKVIPNQAPVATSGASSAAAVVHVKPAPAVLEAPATPVSQAPNAMTPAVSAGVSVDSASDHAVDSSQADDNAIRQQVARDRSEGPKAPQNNLLDISFAAGYLYNDSSSTYSFRKYSTSSPAVSADARIWLSPEFGIGGSYQTTLSGSLSDGSQPSRVVATSQQTITLGIRYRDFFTRDLTYPYLIWGADYYQYHLSVPQDAQSRADITTTGAKLSVVGVFPSRRSYAWNLGFALFPKMYHREGSNAAGFKSGGHADANAVEFLIGGQWQLSPASSMFWRVTYQIEKDLFTGEASVPDPSNNTTPHGVSVTNSSVLLQMGYGWGN